MKYLLKAREIRAAGEWDVVVAGGGPAGCAAAAAAAREGASVLLLESSGSLGGMGTSGLVPAWCPFSDHEDFVYRGIAKEVFLAAKEGMAHVAPDALDWVPIDPERLKRVYDRLLSGAGAQVRFFSSVCDVDAADGRVRALIVAERGGLAAYSAGTYIDCTGDGTVAVLAGAEYMGGGAEVQPASLCFELCGVDMEKYRTLPRPKSPEIIEKILSCGKYPHIRDRHLGTSVIAEGVIGLNAGHIFGVDATDTAALSAAMAEGRAIAAELRDALDEFCPAFRGAHLSVTAPVLGVRESRRIVGDYLLTREDYIARRSFSDEICRNSYFLDIHRPTAEASLAHEAGDESVCLYYGRGESHGIPYRSLTPRGLSNLLVAGRAISCDREIYGSVRVMPACLAMGQGAGVAAAMNAAADGDVHTLDTARLRERLLAAGAYIKGTEGNGYA